MSFAIEGSSVRGINHLVLAGHHLDALRDTYEALGFTVTPRAQHPFGTGNSVIQLDGGYLELLSVTIPQDVIEHGPGVFSFSAFNRDYLARHDGFSMLVLDSADPASDLAAWRAAGLPAYQPFEFSRLARLPSGEEVRIGFSLAFTSNPAAPWLGHFACRHLRPDYFAQPQYLRHANTAQRVGDVWIAGEGAIELADHFRAFIGADPVRGRDTLTFKTASGDIVLARSGAFETAFGVPPPHPADGPHLAGLTIRCERLDSFARHGLREVGPRLVLAPERAFGTALAFSI